MYKLIFLTDISNIFEIKLYIVYPEPGLWLGSLTID